MTRRPFEQLRYRDVPAAPRLPHAFDRMRREDLTIRSAPFGPTRVHVRRLGEGPPLLLVHGLMTSSYSWRYLAEPLSSHFQIIAPDLPGCGRSEPRPEARHSGEALGAFLGELQRALGIEGCAAIGNSLGGYLCLRRALAAPGAFSRLVLLHPPILPELRLRALGAALAVPGARALLRRLIHRDPERWAHKNVHYNDETLKSLEEAREYGRPLATAEGAAAFARYLAEALDARELAATVRELRERRADGRGAGAPVLILYAREDPMVPPRIGPELHALLPGSEFHWIEDSSHFMHVDTPERVLERVLPFLAGGAGGADR